MQRCVYGEHSGYIPPFLEGFRYRISQITIPCLISKKFSVDIDPVRLDERKTKIEEDFVENLGKEIETNIRKGDRKKEEL